MDSTQPPAREIDRKHSTGNARIPGNLALKLEAVHALALLSFCLFVFGGTLSNIGVQIKFISALTGLSSSIYLAAKVPTKHKKDSEMQGQILELQSQITELENSKTWLETLNSNQAQTLLAERTTIESELRSSLISIETQLVSTQSRHADELNSRDKELRSHFQELLATKEAQIISIQKQHQSEINAINSEIEQLLAQTEAVKTDAAERTAAAEKQIALADLKAQETEKKETELEKLSQQIALEEKALRLEEKRIRLDVRDERGQTKELLKNAQLEIQAQNAIIQKFQSEITSLKEQNEQLFNELYTAKKPDADELVTQIQTVLAQQEIQTEFISKRVREGVEVICLKPTSYWEPSKLETVAKILPGTIDIPQPTIQAKNGRIEVKIDRRDELDRIKDVSSDWLEKLYQDAAKDGKNLAILGARGKGKTELAKNYCGLVVRNEPDSEVIYIQPKVDDYATFTINGKVFEPDYIGFETITASSGATVPCAYEGILYLRKLYSERNRLNQQCFADSKPCPKFNRVFFLIDELQLLVSREREFIEPDVIKSEKLRNGQSFGGKIVRDAVSLGRSLGITVLALGQLPNVSVYGWNKNDLYQYITVFMSANIPQAANDYAPTKEEKNRISGDLELWRKRAAVDSTKDYYCYVRPMDKEGYLALLPSVGKYLDCPVVTGN